MYFITDKLNGTDVTALQSAIPRKSFVHDWKQLEQNAKELGKRLTGKEAATNSQTWKLLSATRPETILFTLATSKVSAVCRKLTDFLTKWRDVRNRFPLAEMAPLRITPQLPEYPKLVEDMFFLMLDNKLKSTEEITKYLQPYSPPEPEPPPAPPRKGRVKKATKKGGKLAKGASSPAKASIEAGGEEKPMADLTAVAKTIGSTIGKAVAAVKGAAPAKKAAAPAKKSASAKKAAAIKAPAKSASKKKGPAKKTAAKKKK
jgi:hypothetical protein